MNEIRDGHYTLGNAYLKEGQYDKAVTHFEQAISLDSDFIEAYHALALTYLQQQRLQDAKDAALDALKINATYKPVLSFLQAIEPSMPETPQVTVLPTEQPDVIEKPVEKEDTPKQPNPTTLPEKEKTSPKADDIDIDTELERGIVFLANKQYPQAETAFKKVLKASPNHAIAHYNLAQSYMETGVLTDAKIQVDKALRLNPSYQPAQQLQEGIAYLANKERQRRLQKKLIKYLAPIAILIIAVFIAYRYGGLKVILPQPTPPKISIDTTLEEPEAEPPKPEMPEPEEDIPKRKEITLQKEVNGVQHKSSLEIAKMPARSQTSVDIQQPSSINIDMDTSALDTPDLATDGLLAPTSDSILSPNLPSGSASINKARLTKRRTTGGKSPSKGTSEGIAEGISKTGSEKKNGSGTENKGDGSGEGNSTFSSIIGELTDNIIASSGGLPIDVVFVVDASGSMQNYINAVAEHLEQMVDAYKASKIDYQLGLSHFNMVMKSQQNNIHVFQLTRNLTTYKDRLDKIMVTGDENALDAIDQTIVQMRFRTNTVKHLIVVTDEPFTSLQGHNLDTVIQLCKRNELLVNVLGKKFQDHKRLAKETGGSWHAVPQDPNVNPKVTTSSQLSTNPLTIGNAILADAANMPVDVILFIDSSKSMEDNVTYIKDQIDMWIRNWDIANINYRIGVVRFRTKQSVNMVTVFKPPQTQEKIHSILKLPYSDDENLLQAITDATRRLKLRAKAKTHFIFITDEPGDPKSPMAGTINYLKDIPIVVSVIGTSDKFQQQVAAQTGGVYIHIPNGHKVNEPYR